MDVSIFEFLRLGQISANIKGIKKIYLHMNV